MSGKNRKRQRVMYRGKLSMEFGVFRSSTGELFVWLDLSRDVNPFIWHYLVHPKEKFASIAFRGMLVTRGGKYIWETKEAEAFSDKAFLSREAVRQSKPKSSPAQVRPESIKFSSHYLNTDWIEIIF